MRRTALIAIATLCFVAACGGGDDTSSEPTDADATEQPAEEPADSGDTEGDDALSGPPADVPAACTEAPIEIEFTLSAVPEYPGPFSAQSATGQATPIVPNGDGSLDDLDPAGFKALGADTDLLLYTQWVGDHPFDSDDIGMFSGPQAPPGAVTLALTVVPTSQDGLTIGEVISSSDELEYDSITTFGTVGVFLQPGDETEMYFSVNNLDETQGGTAEVLYVSDEWLCVDWNLAGETNNPEGTYSLSGVVLTPLERAELPFT